MCPCWINTFCHETLDGAGRTLTQSDIITSLLMVQLIGFCRISGQWARCSAFKYLAGACCSSCSTLQKPSTFTSSTCIDLLRGDSCMGYGGYFICYMCNSSISYMLTAACLFILISVLIHRGQTPTLQLHPIEEKWKCSQTGSISSLREELLVWVN